MNKFASFAEYPSRSLMGAEAALLTAWLCLHRYHSGLAVVGGLAVKYLTKPGAGLLPGPVTMDVDFGVSLAMEGGQYGTIADDLSGQGFRRDRNGRYVRQFETMPIYIDFLTEHPMATTGTTHIDGVEAGVFPGVARALTTKRIVTVIGNDLFGAPQKANVPIAEIGPLLVLKLNAFDGRQQPKDAYDILLLVTRYLEGPEAAIAGFRAERMAGNCGYARAYAALRQHFVSNDQSGPLRAAAFVFGDQLREPKARESERRIIEQVVTMGRALLGD